MASKPNWLIANNQTDVAPDGSIHTLTPKSLFFCVGIDEHRDELSLNTNKIKTAFNRGNVKRLMNADQALGSAAINNALDGNPVSLQKATAFCNTVNFMVSELDNSSLPILNRCNIVTCAFFISDFAALKKVTGLSNAQIAKKSGLSEPIIACIDDNYRVGLSHALEICKVLVASCPKPTKAVKSSDGGSDDEKLLAKLRSNDPFCKLITLPKGVVPNPSVKKTADGKYVIKSKDAVAAPATGHKWAISKG